MKRAILLLFVIAIFVAPALANDPWPGVSDENKNRCIKMGKTAQVIMAQRYNGHSAATLKRDTDIAILHSVITYAFERPYITSSYADQQKEIEEFGYDVFGICMDNMK